MRRSLSLVVLPVAFVLGAVFARIPSREEVPVARATPIAAVAQDASAVQLVAEVPFPAGFEPYGGVEPNVFFTRDGAHIIGAQGTYNGRKDLFGWYVFKWYPGRGNAFPLSPGMLTTRGCPSRRDAVLTTERDTAA